MLLAGLRSKWEEAFGAVTPVAAIVLILSFTVAPMPPGVLLAFLCGTAMLLVGMMFFSLGAEMAMAPMGEKLGAGVTKTKKLPLILFLGLLIGVVVTVSEPDLQVLANQVQSIPNAVLILAVGVGVGFFLTVALARILFSVPLNALLIASYTLVFLLCLFTPGDFIAVAFDSGGVTTGPMTVPFIMAFGLGISAIRSDSRAAEDSFGLVALCSVGPILAVLILGMIYHPDSVEYTAAEIPALTLSTDMSRLFVEAIPTYLGEIALSLLPIVVLFAVCQVAFLRLNKKLLSPMLVGVLFTYIGLVVFLTGANVGFMPAGSVLGETLASMEGNRKYVIIPLGMLIGYFIVRAEPAVYVLMKQVEELTDGAISGKSLKTGLSVGVALSIGIAMLRVLTGISLLFFLVPGYLIAIALSFVTPKMFTAIAFDSGGVASGPMTAAFLLPFAVGACAAVGGNIITDAFGVVAMVALTPIITVQILGVVYRFGRKKTEEAPPVLQGSLAAYGDFDVIEL